MSEQKPTYANGRLLPLSDGEKQLISQIRDLFSKMGTKPYQVSVLVVDKTYYIYEHVPRGKVKQ